MSEENEWKRKQLVAWEHVIEKAINGAHQSISDVGKRQVYIQMKLDECMACIEHIGELMGYHYAFHVLVEAGYHILIL